MTRWAIATGDFTPLGGMDRANYALARYLAASGRDVHLVAHRVWPDLAAMKNITVHHAARPLGSHILGAPLLARKASRAAAHLGTDARLLSNGGNTRWRGVTWIHYLHAAYVPQASSARARLAAFAGRRGYLKQEARAIASAPLIICNSERTADDVQRRYGASRERLRVIYYGVDAAQFGEVTDPIRRAARLDYRFAPDRPLAMFVGGLGDRRKGFDFLFDAWRTLCAVSSWDVDLAVVGSGAEARRWRTRAAAAGIGERITFLGFRSDIPRVLSAADVLVHPARYEAYGLGVHEALCRGIPAIVSANAGIAERLTPDFLPLTISDPLTAAALVRRLQAWRENLQLWRLRAQALGTRLRSRSWDDMSRDIAALMERP
jgi:glycosyltransferase involved in cell wall biosynthesis